MSAARPNDTPPKGGAGPNPRPGSRRSAGRSNPAGEGGPRRRVVRIDADAVMDDGGVHAQPASALFTSVAGLSPYKARLLAVGSAREISARPEAAGAERLDRRGCVLIPGLVNAHTHLDLTDLGPRPYSAGAGFSAWLDQIRRDRAADDAAIRAAVRRGVELSLAGGVVAVGDIAGAPGGIPTLAPWRELRESPLEGVSYLEFFSLGDGPDATDRVGALLAEGLRSERFPDADAGRAVNERLRLGVQPHAPHTVRPAALARAAMMADKLVIPASMHLAESAAEREFVSRGAGPHREFLEHLGLWHDGLLADYGRGQHPVAMVSPILGLARVVRWVLAHVNDAPDDAIRALSAAPLVSVAYCPRASAYFGAEREFGPHRYRDMVAAGVNVCLGTDSIVNLPAADVARGGLGVLDEMRLLARRDGVRPETLLAMGTTRGAGALGLGPDRYRFSAGRVMAGVVAVAVSDGGAGAVGDELMASDAAPELIRFGC